MKSSDRAAVKLNHQRKTALLVIDVQQSLFHKATPIYRAEEVLHNITALMERARQAGVPVIFIQHSSQEGMVRGSADWQLHPTIKPLAGEAIVHKEYGNAFQETNLRDVLQSNAVTHLVVTGLVTHGCVRATCLGALKLGYHLTLAADAHSNYSQQAAELIEGLNQNMAEKKAVVLPSSEIHFA